MVPVTVAKRRRNMKSVCCCKSLLIACFVLLGAWLLGACSQSPENDPSFVNIGEFSIKKLPENCTEIRDGAGRILVLVPRGQKPPKGYGKNRIIETPVRRVVAYSGFNIGILKVLGAIDTLVGVTHKRDYWTIDEVVKGMDSGKIACIGETNAIDFEKLKSIEPDLVLTWDACAISMINELGIPGVITTTGEAMDLNTRMRFARFLALFFNREREADEYVAKVQNAIKSVKDSFLNSDFDKGPRPKVIWGDIYEKRVMVEPGNSWAAEMIELAGGDYLFDDISGAS